MLRKHYVIFDNPDGERVEVDIKKIFGFATRPFLNDCYIVVQNDEGKQDNILVTPETLEMVKSDVLRYMNSQEYYNE